MATYVSIMRGLQEVNEGIDRLKTVNAQLLEACELALKNCEAAGFDTVAKVLRAAIKAATGV